MGASERAEREAASLARLAIEQVARARANAVRAVNESMVLAYWNIGRILREHEMSGAKRARYGARIVSKVAEGLTRELGRGFDERNLWYMVRFHAAFPILNAARSESPAIRPELSWTHYRLLLSVESDVKAKLGAKTSEQTEHTVGNGRRIPRAVRSAVWQRDGGCCSFVSADGHRCGERRWLQFDHRTPVALGGESTLANLRLLCRTHNLFEAERVLGEDRVARARERAERERARHSEVKAREASREASRAAAREEKARAA